MKKKISILLAVTMLLSGCSTAKKTEQTTAESTVATTAEAAETMASTTTGLTTVSNPVETIKIDPFNYNLDTIPFGKIAKAEFRFRNDYLKQYWKNQRNELEYHDYSYRNENELILSGVEKIQVRTSTGKITCNEDEMQSVYDAVLADSYISLNEAMEDSVYSYTYYVDSAVFEIEEISTGLQPRLFVKSITSGYNIYDTVTVHAFIHKDSEGRISFLVDPEYLIGIPVFANKPEHLTFVLNGMKVAADSFMVSTGKNSDEEILKAFEGKGEDYFYAEVVFGGVEIYYNSERGCGVSADLISVTPVSDDIEAAISGAFLMNDNEDKNPGMVNTYNVIMNNLDTLYTEKTYGIVLLDMDFDGTPEVLSTRYEWEGDRPNYYGSSPITDIYRIVGEELKYIDSIASTYYSLGGQDGINTLLGLKNLSDGTKGCMATNVLNLTKLENQAILTDVTQFNLSEQIRNCVLLLESKWEKKKLELYIDFDEYMISANEEMLKQVWINLIDNAIKFASDYGVIGIEIKQENDRLMVSVSNSGSEISTENIENIFKKFYQADKSRSSEGNGIGLAIVKRVAELHGGEVSVKSENLTTVFTVTLPTSTPL